MFLCKSFLGFSLFSLELSRFHLNWHVVKFVYKVRALYIGAMRFFQKSTSFGKISMIYEKISMSFS